MSSVLAASRQSAPRAAGCRRPHGARGCRSRRHRRRRPRSSAWRRCRRCGCRARSPPRPPCARWSGRGRRSAPAARCAPGRRALSSASLRERLDRLDADLALRARQQRQQRLDQLAVAELAERAHHDRGGLDVRRACAASPSGAAAARLLPISASASTARSLTHQSASRVAWISESTARSSLVWFRISMAARRMSSSLSRTSCSTASMTFGPPILPSASAARLRTHQSLSLIEPSRYFTDCASPTSFSTSTAARRAFSFSSLSTSIRYFIVSGWFALITTSIARLCTSISGSRSSAATRSMSIGPSMRCSAESVAPRISLFGSLSCPLQRRLHLRGVEARQRC